MLSSVEPLNPDLFEFDGVRVRKKDNLTQLGKLLTSIGTRGEKREPVPTNWSIERLTIRSLPLPKK